MKSIIKIKENRVFHRAYKKGDSLVGPYAVVYVMKNHIGKPRLGITTGKKIGNAVSRNRAKRVIYAAFRQCLPELRGGFDFIIVARPRILSVKSTEVAAALIKLFKTYGILKADENDE
ncbi:MAG: ribonuclease P protein component [Acutalibacteraceae bacterium]|jgi:ribonuclease P protein component